MKTPHPDPILQLTRRQLFGMSAQGIGIGALASLLGGDLAAAGPPRQEGAPAGGLPGLPHFAPKAKRVIFLHQSGGPSQLETFDYKPGLAQFQGTQIPDSVRQGQRVAQTMGQGLLPVARSLYGFAQHGQSGTWVSELLPHTAKIVDDISIVKSMVTDAFNHAPAQLLMNTGAQQFGRPSFGSWTLYGLGSESQDLPGFVVFSTGSKGPSGGASCWGSGFLPSVYQGVQCRSEGDPVLFLRDPEGMDRGMKKKTIDAINDINAEHHALTGDPETLTRMAQYEMAFRMQISVPDVMDISKEPAYVHELYGSTPGRSSFANNCLLARKLVEKGVRFVQLFDWGWDSHGTDENLAIDIGFRNKCREIDRSMTALILDLKQRGLLEETLVVWGGEFGRTPMQENRENKNNPFLGRDHHVEAFTMWMAGGGIKKGMTWGETDEIGYYPVNGKVSVHDVQATILHQLGMDHEKLTYHFQGRPFRLTDVSGKVISEVIA